MFESVSHDQRYQTPISRIQYDPVFRDNGHTLDVGLLYCFVYMTRVIILFVQWHVRATEVKKSVDLSRYNELSTSLLSRDTRQV